MGDVIDLRQKVLDSKTRNFNALIEELRGVINRHKRYGASGWQVCGSTLFLLAQALAAEDPNMERPYMRDLIHAYLDVQTDEALLQIWAETGEVPS
jgi:hypothetical protein